MSTEPGPRPEPVLDAQQTTRYVLGLLGGLSTLASLFGFTFTVDGGAQEVIATVIATLFSVATLVSGLVLPRLQAMKARDLVTPVADPRDTDGTALVRVDTPAAGGSAGGALLG